MSDFFFDYLLPPLAGFIVGYYIILSGGTIMESIFAVLLTVGLTLFGRMLLKIFVDPILIRRRERKEFHMEEMINMILKPLQLSSIKHKGFKVWIDRLERLENRTIYEKGDIYNWTFQHLQHKDYLDILISFQIVEAWIVEINIKLMNLNVYIDGKIKEKYREKLAPYIWDIVQTAFYENTDIDCLKKIKKIENRQIHIARNENEDDDLKIPCIFGEEKIKTLVLKLIGQKEFLSQLKEIQEEYNELCNEFYKRLQKTYLKNS